MRNSRVCIGRKIWFGLTSWTGLPSLNSPLLNQSADWFKKAFSYKASCRNQEQDL